MNADIKNFLRRFFSLRNVIPLFIITAAFIGTFVTSPFGLQRDQLLLALLAFLGIDALLERFDILTNIENNVKSVKEIVESQVAGKNFLKLRKDFPRIEHLIAEAKQEIWISGITLDTTARLTEIFNAKLKHGFKLRFLAVSPQEDVLVATLKNYPDEVGNDLSERIKISLNTIYRRLVQLYPQQVEVRTGHVRPTLGYFIVDPHLEQGYMTVGPYLYQVDGSESPLFLLSRKTEPQWFDTYLKDFERQWNNAIEWKP